MHIGNHNAKEIDVGNQCCVHLQVNSLRQAHNHLGYGKEREHVWVHVMGRK